MMEQVFDPQHREQPRPPALAGAAALGAQGDRLVLNRTSCLYRYCLSSLHTNELVTLVSVCVCVQRAQRL